MIFLVCHSCKAGFNYLIDEDLCKGCGKPIVDPEIKPLVFALNLCGVATERSCEGHEDFESGCYPFPWVTVSDEKDLEKLNLMITKYNLAIIGNNLSHSQWKTGFNIMAMKYWLFPVNSNKGAELLQKEATFLAEFITAHY